MDLTSNPTGKYGGSIKEGGDSLSSYTSAKEEAYFRQQDQKLLEDLSKSKSQSKSDQHPNTNKQTKA